MLLKIKTDVPMVYNRAKIKMKKIILTMTLIAGVVAGSMTLSAFTTAKHNERCANTKITVNNDDAWKLFKEGVSYCDGDKDVCMGTGCVWVNTDYQTAFSYNKTGPKYDLTQSSKKDGYNMRFWDNHKDKYFYIYINIPESAYRL